MHLFANEHSPLPLEQQETPQSAPPKTRTISPQPAAPETGTSAPIPQTATASTETPVPPPAQRESLPSRHHVRAVDAANALVCHTPRTPVAKDCHKPAAAENAPESSAPISLQCSTSDQPQSPYAAYP